MAYNIPPLDDHTLITLLKQAQLGNASASSVKLKIRTVGQWMILSWLNYHTYEFHSFCLISYVCKMCIGHSSQLHHFAICNSRLCPRLPRIARSVICINFHWCPWICTYQRCGQVPTRGVSNLICRKSWHLNKGGHGTQEAHNQSLVLQEFHECPGFQRCFTACTDVDGYRSM